MLKYLFFILQFSTILFAQNYLWPTDASKYLTSSFCEYRPGHYHAALDIKTWNKEGYKCFAVDDGVIERIKISPHGAGKALYIKLKDGRKAVYFHLQKYSSELESKIREIQLAEKRYSIEWWPKYWKVKKGDLIGYSGQTGIGVPHLHFEIRDELDRPLNPLEFYDEVKDRIRPQLKRLLVIPQDKYSRVNGSFIPAQYDLTYIRDGIFIIKEPVHARGKIGLALNGYDMADGVNNKFAWYKVTLAADGEKIFEYAYDRVSFKNTRYVDVDVYYPEKRNSGRSFNKLYLEPFNILDFYNRNLGDGLINIEEASVSFEIEAKDYFGNTSIVKGTLLPEKPGLIGPPKVNLKEQTAFLKLHIPDDLKNITFSSGKNQDSLEAIEYFEIVDRDGNYMGLETYIKVRLAKPGDRIIQSIIEDKFGQTDTVVTLLAIPQKHIQTNVQLMGKHLYFMFDDLADSKNLKLLIRQGSDTLFFPLNRNGSVAEFVLSARDLRSDSFNVRLEGDNYVYLDTSLTVFKMIPGEPRQYKMFNDSLRIDAGTLNAYDTLFFNAKYVRLSDNNFDQPILSEGYFINTGKHILNSNIDLSVKIDSVAFKAEQIGFYSIDDGELEYEGGKYNPATGFISFREKEFSIFVVAADTIPPSIELINFRENGSYKNVSAFRFKVEDEASGIGTDKNIEVYFDDQYLVPEWDPEQDIVKSNVHFEPETGKHKVSIICKDRAGNTTQKIIPINIL